MALRGQASFEKAGFQLWTPAEGGLVWRRDVPGTDGILGGPVFIEVTNDEDRTVPWPGTGIVVSAWKEQQDRPTEAFDVSSVGEAIRLARDLEDSIPRDNPRSGYAALSREVRDEFEALVDAFPSVGEDVRHRAHERRWTSMIELSKREQEKLATRIGRRLLREGYQLVEHGLYETDKFRVMIGSLNGELRVAVSSRIAG